MMKSTMMATTSWTKAMMILVPAAGGTALVAQIAEQLTTGMIRTRTVNSKSWGRRGKSESLERAVEGEAGMAEVGRTGVGVGIGAEAEVVTATVAVGGAET